MSAHQSDQSAKEKIVHRNERTNRSRIGGAVMLVAVLALPAAGRAQIADVAGKWDLTVRTDQGTTHPTFTLEQDEEALTGHYSSETLGEVDFTGTITGSSISISFDASVQGQSVPVVYRGSLNEDGTMSGTIDLAGGALKGTFTATREG